MIAPPAMTQDPYKQIDLAEGMREQARKRIQWRKTTAAGLDLDYTLLLPRYLADELMARLEEVVEYYSEEMSRVKVFGKWHKIPRQQVAYGDIGLSYTFSGLTVPAKEWIPALKATRDLISEITGTYFNFVLVNRYRDGSDRIGPHRDNETDLDHNAPIASLSLGERRTFVLKHGDCRKKGQPKTDIPAVKIELEHGSLVLMNPPTNENWYHSIPPRKSAKGVRINLTFRKLLPHN